MAANDLRNIIRVETQGIEEFLAFTKKAKSELLAIKKIMQDKGFKGSDSDAMKMAAAYRREMLKAIQDVGKANSKMLLGVMNAQKNAAQSKGGAKSDANVRELEIAIAVVKELTKATNESKKAVDALEKSVSDLNKEQSKGAKVKKEVVQLTQAELTALEAEKIKKRENTLIAKQNAIVQTQGKDTIAGLRAQLSLTSLQWSKLTQEELENTENGRFLNAEKTRLTAQLKKLEKATGDHRREVGNYTLAGNKAAGMVSRLGLAGNKLTGVFGRVGRALDNFGLGAFALAAAAATIAWQFFADNFLSNTDEVIAKNNELKESIASLTIDLQKTQREGKFLEIDNSNLSEAEKRLRKIGLLQEDLGKAQSDLGASANEASELDSKIRLNSFKTELEKNEAIKRALELDIERAKLAQSVIDSGKEINKIQEEGNKAAQDAAKKRQEESDKRLENEKKLAADLEKIQADRLNAEEDLENALIQLQIEAIEDATKKAIAAEIERNRLQQDATADNFIELRKQRLDELEKIKEYLGEKSEEYLRFEVETYSEIDKLRKLNDSLSEQQEKAHQAELKKIKSDAVAANRIAAFTAAKEAVSDQKKYNDEKKAALKQAEDELLEETKAYNAAKKEEEEKTAEDAKKLQDAIVSGVDVAFNSIQKIMAAASAAENKMFEDAIAARQKTIDDLGKRLENATGVERQFLERRIAQEKAALDKQNKQAEQARKDAAESARAVALIQAIVNTALAVTSALATPPYPVGAALAITAGIAGAAEITAIALQKFAMGGEIKGNSHAQGGVPIKVKGGPMIEAEGGEFIVNKYSTKKYRKEIEYYNNLGLPGGGRKFQFGGEVSPNFQAIAKASNGEQRRTAKEIANTQIVVSVTDITNMQKRVANVAQKSSF